VSPFRFTALFSAFELVRKHRTEDLVLHERRRALIECRIRRLEAATKRPPSTPPQTTGCRRFPNPADWAIPATRTALGSAGRRLAVNTATSTGPTPGIAGSRYTPKPKQLLRRQPSSYGAFTTHAVANAPYFINEKAEANSFRTPANVPAAPVMQSKGRQPAGAGFAAGGVSIDFGHAIWAFLVRLRSIDRAYDQEHGSCHNKKIYN
jgi:hypothetical protein